MNPGECPFKMPAYEEQEMAPEERRDKQTTLAWLTASCYVRTTTVTTTTHWVTGQTYGYVSDYSIVL